MPVFRSQIEDYLSGPVFQYRFGGGGRRIRHRFYRVAPAAERTVPAASRRGSRDRGLATWPLRRIREQSVVRPNREEDALLSTIADRVGESAETRIIGFMANVNV